MQTIKQLRDMTKMTQKDLADRLEVTTTAVSSWERGEYEPRVKQVREMAQVFGLACSDDIDIETPRREYLRKKESGPVSEAD